MTDQDHINEKNVCLVIQGTKLTGKGLAFAMRAFLAAVPKRLQQKQKCGKQSVKDLAKNGSKLENIEVSDECVKSFERIAAKYAVDYAVMKDTSEEIPKHLIFFKSRDADSMTAAFREYSAKQLCKSATRTPLRETLTKMAEKVKEQPAKAQEKIHEKAHEVVR